MTYDDWKTTDDTPKPERTGWCDTCRHYDQDGCDCPCCTVRPPTSWVKLQARKAVVNAK